MMFYSRVLGAGSGFPKGVLTNADFEEFLDTSDEWITSRTGIKERHIADPKKGEATADFAEEASRNALKQAQLNPEDIEMIVVGTVTPDTVMPCVANQLQARLGCPKAFTFDLQAACSGFLYGLSIADHYIRMGTVKTALVVGGETLSSLLNWKDRGTCILFGDGAGAVVLQRTDSKDHSVIATRLYSDGRYGDLLRISHGYAKVPPTSAGYQPSRHKIEMQGGEIFKHAVRDMVDCTQALLKDQGIAPKDVDYYLFHQANLRIIDMCIKSLGIDRTKTWINLDRYGNTSAATLPVCLDEAWRAGAISPGKLVLMTTFGGGFTWGSALIRL